MEASIHWHYAIIYKHRFHQDDPMTESISAGDIADLVDFLKKLPDTTERAFEERIGKKSRRADQASKNNCNIS